MKKRRKNSMGKEIISKKAIIFGIILLFIGTSVIPFIGSSENAGGGWWNENWSYCRVLPVINPSNSYQMKIIVGKSQGGDVNCNGHCKNDFSDIRFVDVDNTTQLAYWMESYSDGNQATFWVKLPSDVESHSKILMYYGNTDALSMSDGSATFLWFDDFHTNTIGDWTRVEDFQQHGWIFYNNKYHSSMNSARLRSNVDCVDITAESWPNIGEISQGLKGENDNMLWANTTTISYSSRSDGGATNDQPRTSLASNNAYGGTNGGDENVMWKGTNGYVTELLYSYPNNYLGGKIWDSSAHLLWNTPISSYIPEHMTYLFWYLKDLHNQIGYQGAGLYYDAVQKKLIICCNSTNPNAPWLKLRYNWMFLANYVESEPTISASGNEIKINTPPTAEAGGPYSAQVNTLITFNGAGSYDPDGTITGYRWDLNNDGTYTGWLTSSIIIFSYASPGTYTITLQVKDNNNATDTDTATVTITTTPPSQNIPPTAEANGPYSGYINYPVAFISSGSTIGSEGTNISYYWTFGDGAVSSQQNPTHTYTASGTYIVSFSVTIAYGAYALMALDNTTATITKLLPNQNLPVADAGGPYHGNTNVSIVFDGSGSYDSNGTIISYLWFFGDGITGTGISPSHMYTTAGRYTITLTVIDNNNITASNTTTATINVSKTPRLVLTVSASNIEVYEENNEKTITLTVYCYDNSVNNISVEVLTVSNLTITQLSPNLNLKPGEHADLVVNVKTPEVREGVKWMNETTSLQVVGDNGIISNVEQINFKVIPKNIPGFEAVATIVAVGSAGALVTFFRRRNGNR